MNLQVTRTSSVVFLHPHLACAATQKLSKVKIE
jgi:hypothetical protein